MGCSIVHLLFISILLTITHIPSTASSGSIGVNYGRVANNLPFPTKVVQLLKSSGITNVKLYDADSVVLRALAGTGVKVVISLPNELLASAAARPAFALSWARRNVAAYRPATLISAVAVGNEVFADPRGNLTPYLLPAMINLHSALAHLRLDDSVKVSSPMALTALSSSYPPSSGSFRPELIQPVIKPMLELLRRTGSFLMVNAYPFFAYEANSDVISLDYALFRPNSGVLDPGTGLKYYNLFDAQIDAVFAATSALGYNELRVVVSETGWPSKGDPKEIGASAANAAAYNGNLIRRVVSGNAGTPLKPAAEVEVFLFALFNENQKPGPTSERNYGLFYPDESKVYDVAFNGKDSGGMRWQEERGPSGGWKTVTATGEKWCVANGMVGRERLQAALDYACGEGGADCGGIQKGSACFEPNTVEAHASYAFNSYYQKKGRLFGTCDFEGAAYVVSQPPKIGKCTLSTTGGS